MTDERAKSGVNSSATHVFKVLRFVARAPEPLGVTEIARRLSLPISTVFRALSTVEEAGYLQRYKNAPRFELGMMPHLLNRALFKQFKLHSQARPLLLDLARLTGETVSLWARLGWYAVRIGGAFGSSDIYHQSRLGDVVLLEDQPGGRPMLNALGVNDRAAYAAFVESRHSRHERVGDIGLWQAAVLLDAEENPVAAIAVDRQDADESAQQHLETASAALEALMRDDPQGYRSPFAHLDPDTIVLTLSSRAYASHEEDTTRAG